MFTPSCLYQNGSDSINKLVGICSFEGPHYNSVRIGWRANGNQIEILSYCYINGQRKFRHMGYAQIGVEYNWAIFEADGQYVIKFGGYMRYTGVSVLKVAMLLRPYFGGKLPAPHTMHIHLTITNKKPTKMKQFINNHPFFAIAMAILFTGSIFFFFADAGKWSGNGYTLLGAAVALVAFFGYYIFDENRG